MRLIAPVLALIVVGSACSVQDSPNRRDETDATVPATTETADASPEPAAADAGSVGLLTVGDSQYSLVFDCYAPGAGEILAIGVGTDPLTDTRVEAYVQAFLGTPYFGVEIEAVGEEPVLYEAALEGILEFSFADDVLRVDDVALVTELDLDTLTGIPAGLGSVVVECREYLDELPADFVTG